MLGWSGRAENELGIGQRFEFDCLARRLKSPATVKPKKIAAIIGRVMAYSPARVPGLPDYFYLERMRLLVESGVLRLVGDIEDPMKGEVHLP